MNHKMGQLHKTQTEKIMKHNSQSIMRLKKKSIKKRKKTRVNWVNSSNSQSELWVSNWEKKKTQCKINIMLNN